MSRKRLKNLSITMVGVLVGFTLIMGLGWCNRAGNGIHSHSSGKTVYLEGSSCVINMDNTTVMVRDQLAWSALKELNEQYIWCTEQHENYLNK